MLPDTVPTTQGLSQTGTVAEACGTAAGALPCTNPSCPNLVRLYRALAIMRALALLIDEIRGVSHIPTQKGA